jgi:hypothetical protein
VWVIGAVEIVIGIGISSLLAYSYYHYNEIQEAAYDKAFDLINYHIKDYGLAISKTNCYDGILESEYLLGCKISMLIMNRFCYLPERYEYITPDSYEEYCDGLKAIYQKFDLVMTDVDSNTSFNE